MPKMSTKDIMRVAVEADVDERTVRKRLNGETVQPRNKERVDKAIKNLGLTQYAPKDDEGDE